jgi:hypothetical protein
MEDDMEKKLNTKTEPVELTEAELEKVSGGTDQFTQDGDNGGGNDPPKGAPPKIRH